MKSYGNSPIKKWLCIIICILIISISVSFLVSKYLLDKVYESSGTLIVHATNSGDDYIRLRDARTYRAIATSNQMMGEIITWLDLPYDIKDIQTKITVSYEEDIGLIYITAEDKDPDIAFRIVESLMDMLQKRVEELFGENYLKVVDNPYISYTASRPNVPLNMVIAAVFALLLSALIIVWDEKRR